MRTDTGVIRLPMTGSSTTGLGAGHILKRIYRAVRVLPDRLLHRSRHRAVLRQLSRLDRPRSILVVCHGNICRSPYLEAVLKRALPALRVASAGFVGQGLPVPPHSLTVAAERGLDLSAFRSRPLVPAIVRDVDLVIVMDDRQARHVSTYLGVATERVVIAGDLDSRPGPTRAIADPWQQPVDVFVSSFDRLDRCAATLVRRLSKKA